MADSNGNNAEGTNYDRRKRIGSAIFQVMPALVLDLDGTIRYSKSGEFINGPDDVALFDDVEKKLWEYKNRGHLVFGVSNQGGVAFGLSSLKIVHAELDATLALFEDNPFNIIKFCCNHPDGTIHPYNTRSLLRKPDIGMLAILESASFENGFMIDWDHSLIVGDRAEDEEMAKRAGVNFAWANDFFNREDGEKQGVRSE